MQTGNVQTSRVREWISTLFIYQRTIVSLTLFGGVAAAAFAFLQPKLYEASVQMWVQDENSAIRSSTNYAADSAARVRTLLSNLREVIYSRQVLEDTLKKADATASHHSEKDEADSSRPRPDQSVSRLVDAIRLDGPAGSEFGSSQIFFVRLRQRDPKLAQQLLTGLLESFRGRYKHLSTEQAMHLYDETSAAAERAREQLGTATDSFDKFVQEMQGGMSELNSLSGSTTSDSELRRELTAINDQLLPAESELTLQTALLEEMQKARDEGVKQLMLPGSFVRDYPALDVSARELVSARIQMDDVAARTTAQNPEYPAAQERLRLAEKTFNNQLDQVADAVQREIAARTELVEFLQNDKDMFLGKLATLSNKFLQYDGLKQEVARCRAAVADAEKRRSEAFHGVLSTGEETQFATMDGPRTSAEPISPKPALTVTMGLMLGLFCGSVFSLVTRRFSQVVYSEADLAGIDDSWMIVSVPKVPIPLQKAS